MRPASALLADGPQNLRDALALAAVPGARGVLAVMAQQVFAATGLRKAHSYRLDALRPGDAGPLARIEEGRLRRFRDWPEGSALGLAAYRTVGAGLAARRHRHQPRRRRRRASWMP